jgi:HPt (histidine-containing phosphotransfer) domain-containing protein
MLETKIINSLRALGEDFLCEIIVIYLRDLHRFVDNIEQSVQNHTAEEGEIASHSLKGASYSLGAKTVGDICYAFEKGFENEEYTGMEELLIRLKDEVFLVQAEMTHLKQKLERSMEVYSDR